MTRKLDDMKTYVATHGGDTLEKTCVLDIQVEDVAVLIILGEPQLVLKTTKQVVDSTNEVNELTILVGSWDGDGQWTEFLERHGQEGNLLRIHAAGTTPYIATCRGEERRVAYYHCVGSSLAYRKPTAQAA
jgi:hypothetical protein